MTNTKMTKASSLIICILLVGSMLILSSKEIAAQSIGGTIYEDVNMNGIFDGGEAGLAGATVFLDPPTGGSVVSGGGGAYNIPTAVGYHWVTARMPGYKTVTKNVNVTGAMTVNIGLVPFESITGRAVKTDGTGITGMHIEVYLGAQHLTQYDTFTDAFGNYCVHGLPPGVYNLRIMKAEYYDQWKYNINVDGITVNAVLYNWHTTANVDFTNLSYDHGVIFGTVSTGVGTLSGAVVEVPGLGLSTTTDNQGNYTIHNLPAGWYYIVVRKNGFQTGVEFVCVTNGTTGPTGPIDFTLARSTGFPIIEGAVSDGVQAIENAVVEIPGLTWTLGSGNELYTDKAGYYIFADYAGSTVYVPHVVPAGKYTIVVRNEAGSTTDEEDNHHKTNARIVIAQLSRVTRADFRLEENYGIKFGRVINTDGIGVEGARVYVPNSPYITYTDSNGVFALELPSETYSEDCDTAILPYQTAAGFDEMNYCGMTDTFQITGASLPFHRMHKARYLIRAEGANYVPTLEYFIPVPGGPGLLNPDDPCELCVNGIILIPKTGILKGQVYLAGQPVTNGFVFVAGRDVPLQANGYYETHDVPIGIYTAAVIDPARTILGTRTNISVYHDQISYEIIYISALPTTRFISGFIYSNKVRPDGAGNMEPDPNAYSAGAAFDPGEGIYGVTVATTTTTVYFAVTDTYGFYCITGIPTTVISTTIVATKTGYITIANPSVTPAPNQVFLSGFAGTPGATVSPMSKFRGSLSGRVTNENGRDVSGAIVSIWAPAESMDETDTNGFYIFEDVEYGSYLIKVCGGGTCGINYRIGFSSGSYAPVTVDGNKTKDITVERKRGRVEGIVDDGTYPLVDVAVRVSGMYSASTDSVGYYTILSVPSGTHTAYAYRYGYQLQKHNNADASIGITGGQIFTANFTLTAGIMTTGWVEGFITLELTDGFCDIVARLNPSFASADTDSEGYYLITNVSSGSGLYVHGEKSNYEISHSEPFAVSPGVGTWVTLIHLRRCYGIIEGYITDSQTGLPVTGATVKLSDMNRNDTVSLWYPGLNYYTDYLRTKIYETTTTATAEAFTDTNLNGSYDLGEPFTDTNGNGQWDGAGYYRFTYVPWSDANTSGLNKTWAWTVVVIKTGYAVGTSNAAVACGATSTVSFTIDPVCAVSGYVTSNGCAYSTTVTAEWIQIPGITEGTPPTMYGWTTSGTDTVPASGGSYYIGHLRPGAYNVTAVTVPPNSCAMTFPLTAYTGANSIALNYRQTTPNVDFTFSVAPILVSPANGATGVSCTTTLDWNDFTGATFYTVQVSVSNTFATTLVNQNVTASQYMIPSGTLSSSTLYYWRVSASNSGWSSVWSFTTGTCVGAAPVSPIPSPTPAPTTPPISPPTPSPIPSPTPQPTQPPTSPPSQPPGQKSSTTDKFLREAATDYIQQAKALQSKVYEKLKDAQEVSTTVKDYLNLADTYLNKAQEYYSQKQYGDAIQWAEKAIYYYEEILKLLT